MTWAKFLSPVKNIPTYAWADLDVNVPDDVAGYFQIYLNSIQPLHRVPPPKQGKIRINQADYAEPKRLVFLPADSSGIWFADGFQYQEGVTSITFTEPPGAEVAPTHYVEGNCFRDGSPFAGEVHVVSAFDRVHLGSASAEPSTGSWRIEVAGSGDVFAFVAENYGRQFESDMLLDVGDIVHPTAANQFVYEVTVAGRLPSTEPLTWPTDGAFAIGTVLVDAKPYPAPQIHGPLTPKAIT